MGVIFNEDSMSGTIPYMDGLGIQPQLATRLVGPVGSLGNGATAQLAAAQ